MDDFPLEEYEVVRKYIEDNYGHKCEEFGAGCITCFIWAGLDVVETFAEYEPKESNE